MDRREFLKSTGAGAAAAATAVVTPAAAEATISAPAVGTGLQELHVAVAFKDGFAGPADWLHRLARGITSLSNGRYRVTPTFGVENASAAVRSGAADLCFAPTSELLAVHRGFAYLAGLPGNHGLPAATLQSWIKVGGGESLFDDLAADFGLKPLLAAHTGARTLTLSSERVDSMQALVGRKIFVDGLGRDVARGLGLEAVSMSPDQVASAMRTGNLHIAESGGAIVSYAFGLPAVAAYSAGASLNRNGTTMMLAVRRSLWDRLSEGDQAMLASAASEEYQRSIAEEEAHGHLLYPAPAAASVWPIAADFAHAVESVADAVVAHAASTDQRSRRIADSYAAYRSTVIGEMASV